MIFNKKLSMAMVTMFTMLIFSPASIQASQVHVTIDGRQVSFTDQGPTIVDGRTLVPVRGVFEELGFEVNWEQDTETARLIRSEHEVALTIGSATFITNDESRTLDVPAQIIGGRTMLPIRAVLESVGYSVGWVQETNTVSISSSGMQATNENIGRFNHSDGINEDGFWEGITALDYVEIFDYNNMEIPNFVHHVPDVLLEQQIQDILFQFPARIMDRAVNDGDTINIDFVGSVDGVEFENGSAEGLTVIIGETSFIVDFLEQLIGHMPGDTINVEVTFPDVYPQNVSLQGEDALIVTTINFIIGEGQSDFTDEFVVENLYDSHGWTTVSETEEGIRREFQRIEIGFFIEDYFMNEVNVSSIPEKLIRYQEQSIISNIERNAIQFGLTLNEYLDMAGYDSVDDILDESMEIIIEMARRTLIVQAVAEDIGISISREDVGDFFEENFRTRDYSLYEEELGLPYIVQVILTQRVFDHIVENAILL